MPDAGDITVHLTREQLDLLIDALDSHEYWQVGNGLPRKDGLVFLPGDQHPDRFWEELGPTDEQRAAIVEVMRCRDLAARLVTTATGRTDSS